MFATATIKEDITPAGYGPSDCEMEIVTPKIERIGNETLDEAIARLVGYQIDNGLVKLDETRDGWKATVCWGCDGKPRIFSAFKKQQVLNQVYSYMNPDYVVFKA